jgi:hypothetical protein
MDESTFRIVITVAVALAVLAFLIQAGVVVALYKVIKALQAKVNETTARVTPLLDQTREIVAENRPRISAISGNAVEISNSAAEMAKSAREQVTQMGMVVRDASSRAKVRVAQIDESIDTSVQKAEQAGVAIKAAAMKPVVHAQGILAGIQAAVEAYGHSRRSSVAQATQDEEMFI